MAIIATQPYSSRKISTSPPHSTATYGPFVVRAKILHCFPIHMIFSPSLWLLFLMRTQSSTHGKEPINPLNGSSQHKGRDLLEIPLHSWTPKFPIFLRTLGCWVSGTVGLSFSHLAGVPRASLKGPSNLASPLIGVTLKSVSVAVIFKSSEPYVGG